MRFRVSQQVIFSVLIVAAGLTLAGVGCSKKKTDTENSTAAQKSETAVDSGAEESVEKEDLAQDLFQLMKLAEQQNANGEFEAAFASWKKIHQHVAKKYGIDQWQTVSAEFAMKSAQQRTRMSAADQKLALKLTQLTSTASKLIDDQRYHEARLDIEQAADISTRLWGKESYISANVNFIRAQCYLGLGMHERAVAVLNDVVSLRIMLTGANHPDVEATLELLAKSNSYLKNHTAAQQSLEKLVKISKTLWGEESEVYAVRCNDLAVSYNNSRKAVLSIPLFDTALQIREKQHGREAIQVGHIKLNKGIALAQIKDFGKAQECLKDTYRIFRKHKLTKNDASWTVLLDQLGTISLILKENEQGQKYFSELVDIWKQRVGDSHVDYGKSLFKLSVSIGNQGKYKDAEPIMKRAISIFEDKLGYSNKMLHQPLSTYARLLEKMGVPNEAQRIKDRAVKLAGFQELPD